MASPARIVKMAALRLAQLLRVSQPERVRRADAQRFWRDPTQDRHAINSHWKGDAGLTDEVFALLGQQHLEIYRQLARMIGLDERAPRIVEWGCGGGVNAVAFASICERYVGVEISQPSLDECSRVLGDRGRQCFQPVLIDIDQPEQATARIVEPCDLFLCTYVFELIPSQEYGERILRVARDLLRPGGLAMIQIRYATSDWRTRPRPWGYRRNLANMTTYAIDDFWQRCERALLRPHGVILQPSQPLLDEARYAYFGLTRS